MLQLTIYAYADPYLTKELSQNHKYVCLINPATYSHSYSIDFISPASQAKGSGGQSRSFKGIKAEEISFSLVFDGTGAIPEKQVGNKRNGVMDVRTEISNFKKTVYSYQGTIHRPAYLKLAWGNNFVQDGKGPPQDFCCQLKSMDISYDLFSADGKPLRANMKLGFVEPLWTSSFNYKKEDGIYKCAYCGNLLFNSNSILNVKIMV